MNLTRPIPLALSNSSPLIALARIGRADLLTRVCDRVIVPQAVADELGNLPDGILIEPLHRPQDLTLFPTQLHAGECAVILLALQQSAKATLLLDDWYARAFAQRQGLRIVGTIGLIIIAKRRGIIDRAVPLFDDLRRAGFHMTEPLLEEARSLVNE